MPDTSISALNALTALAAPDEFVIVDKSDTTMGAGGTNKRMPLSSFLADPVVVGALGRRTRGTSATPPAAVAVGEEYLDTTNNRLWMWNGTAWKFVRSIDGLKRAGVLLSAAGQAIGAAGSVAAIWTTENSDVDGWIAAPGNLLTVPAGWGGVYDFTYRVVGSTSSSAQVELSLIINGTQSGFNSGGSFANAARALSGVLHGLVPGDTLSFVCFNSSGISITFTSYLAIDWLYS